MIKALLPRTPLAVNTIVHAPVHTQSSLSATPLTGGAILGNRSIIEIEADCWSP